MKKDDKAQAVYHAAKAWVQQHVKENAAEFARAQATGAVSVVVRDIGGECPRVDLFIGETLIGSTQLFARNAATVN